MNITLTLKDTGLPWVVEHTDLNLIMEIDAGEPEYPGSRVHLKGAVILVDEVPHEITGKIYAKDAEDIQNQSLGSTDEFVRRRRRTM